MADLESKLRNRELAILNAIAEALNRSIDLTEILDATLIQAAELMDLQTGWIWLYNRSDSAYLAAAQKLPPALNAERMEGSCYCLDTFQSGDMDGAANVNVITCSRLKHLHDGTGGLRYHASIPLYAHGNKIGVLNLASQDWRELSAEDLRLLYTIGDMVSIAIERARLFEDSVQLGALEERNRLAREIHDTLAQSLAGISMQLEATDEMLESGTALEQVRASLQLALDLTRSSLDDARRSVLDLRAAPLEGRHLAGALRELVESAQANHAGTHFQFQVTGANQPLPASIEVGLFRIAQEALSNAINHAQAELISLTLSMTPDNTRLIIRDDGVGIDNSRAGRDGFGLIGMNERARLLNGSLDLQSARGQGTLIEVLIPR